MAASLTFQNLSVGYKAKPPSAQTNVCTRRSPHGRRQKAHKQKKRVHFSLPANHAHKNSTEWRRQWEKPTSKLRQLLKDKLLSGVLDGSIPSAASDTGATASAMKPSDPTIPTGIQSNTSFGGALATSRKQQQLTSCNWQLKLREPARSAHIVPKVKDEGFPPQHQ